MLEHSILVPISTVLVRISTVFATNSFPTKKRFSNCGLFAFVVIIKVVEWRGEKKSLTKTKTIAIDKSDERLFQKIAKQKNESQLF
jgi:hypothetical protein